MELWHAWGDWVGGTLNASDMLYGISIRSWGRIGLTLNVAASLILLWQVSDSAWFRAFAPWLRVTTRWATSPGDLPLDRTPPTPRGAGLALHSLIYLGLAIGMAPIVYLEYRWPALHQFLAWAERSYIGGVLAYTRYS